MFPDFFRSLHFHLFSFLLFGTAFLSVSVPTPERMKNTKSKSDFRIQNYPSHVLLKFSFLYMIGQCVPIPSTHICENCSIQNNNRIKVQCDKILMSICKTKFYIIGTGSEALVKIKYLESRLRIILICIIVSIQPACTQVCEDKARR